MSIVKQIVDKLPLKEAIALSVAGSDSSAGAGIQADIKSGAATNGYMATAITAITAQNGVGVDGVMVVDDAMVKAQIDSVASDMRVVALKSGMLPTVECVKVVIDAIERYNIPFCVVDPVMVATSGATLISEDVARYIIDKLLPKATVVTPNIVEAAFISGLTVENLADFDTVAPYFEQLGVKFLLLKGGHLGGGALTDRLYDFKQGRSYDFTFAKIDTPNTHGTGCSLSSAIASYLSQGEDVVEAVRKAEEFVHKAIERGKDRVYSSGHGAIAHF